MALYDFDACVLFAWFFYFMSLVCRMAYRKIFTGRCPDEDFERIHFVGNLMLFGIYCQNFLCHAA
ncbi:MAG: hypothetical protein CVU51_07840 [Deltaproteobacteria bacterium HGW-Deltaproteobacteria-1]|nr:MAG: hypothetical protein CVU51_07840 [Deltaproteobacteria bacterium HGW-Deltaproteobacteria-1]